MTEPTIETARVPDAEAAPGLTGIRLFVIVVLPFGCGYFMSYLFRTVNSVIAPQLVRDVGLSAGDLGLLTAAYLFAFAVFQIPNGILLDRFGPRRVQSALLLSAVLGAVIFSVSDSREMLMFGRALIGLGFAGGLMSGFKLITMWYPKERWAVINGCYLFLGGLGAAASTAPVEVALQLTDWRGVFIGLAVLTLAASAAIFFIVPDKQGLAKPVPAREQLRGVAHVFTDRLFWAVSPHVVFTQAAGLAIQGLWAGPWLRDVAGLDRSQTAFYLLCLNLGLAGGFIALGWLSGLLAKRGVQLWQTAIGGTLLFFLVQLVVLAEVDVKGLWVWILFGFACNSTAMCYPYLAQHFPLEYVGRANAALNFISFVGAFLIQYGIGFVIDLFAPAAPGQYKPVAYQAAFGIVLGIQVLCFVWYLYAVPRAQRAGSRN
ncbi:MAG: nitrate/nitrite transporter [Alphaproteobacteria bacterium]